jgi:tripartite-type tricarboxylate transporter receptor subunit TctC
MGSKRADYESAGRAMGTCPYRGGGPALFAVVSGQVDFYLSSVPAALTDIRNGKLKPIATTGKSRDPTLPDVPTVAELGLPNYEVLNWNALVAPAETPRSIIDKLHEVTVEILSSPTLRKHLIEQGAEPAPMTAEDFAEFMKAESVKSA